VNLRRLLADIADLLGELTITAANIAARPAGTIGRTGHGDGIRVSAIDPWVCPKHPYGDANPNDPGCMCDLGTVRTRLLIWVTATLEDEDNNLTTHNILQSGLGPNPSNHDLAQWLADHHTQAEHLENSHALTEDMHAVRTALERVLRVRDATEAEQLHAWLPVHQAMAVAGLHRPGIGISRRTAYRLSTRRAGAVVVQPATLLAWSERSDEEGA
jgi:hypothetical protein